MADSGFERRTNSPDPGVVPKDGFAGSNQDLGTDTDINEKYIPKPKGYVIQDNAYLYEHSTTESKKLQRLQKGEFIYLLETSLTNEKGEMVSYPTWYKITSANSFTGWVRSDHVSFGH